MRCSTKSLKILTASLFTVVFLAAAQDARACMVDDCSICWANDCQACELWGGGVTCYNCGAQIQSFVPAFTTEVRFPRVGQATIKVPSYTTTHLEPTTSCVTALSPMTGVAQVDRVVNHDGRTGLPFDEVSFFSSPGPANAIARLAEKEGLPLDARGEWFPFQSHITGSVRDGVPNYFVIHLTLEPGVTEEQFLRTLTRGGYFLTSSSDANGVPTSDHFSFRRLGAGDIFVHDFDRERPKPRVPRPRQP